jgi:hypothetical protein
MIQNTLNELKKITKDWSNSDKTYNVLLDSKKEIKTEIENGNIQFLDLYEIIIEQLFLFDLGMEDDFDGRVFRDFIKKF